MVGGRCVLKAAACAPPSLTGTCSADDVDSSKVENAALPLPLLLPAATLLRDALTAQVVLSKMGAKLVHCGSLGNGHVAKLRNNLLLAVCMLGTR